MSGQTQPGTALQSLAEKLRTDAIAIFGEGQAERDIIEWFYGSLLAAAPATPAAQGAVPEPVRDALAAELAAIKGQEPDCDRSACGDFSPGRCDNPDCSARRERKPALPAAPEGGEV